MSDVNLGRVAFLMFWSYVLLALASLLAIPVTCYLLARDGAFIPFMINIVCLLTLPHLRLALKSWLLKNAEELVTRAEAKEADLRARMTSLRVTTKGDKK